jgi:hypothetical protein
MHSSTNTISLVAKLYDEYMVRMSPNPQGLQSTTQLALTMVVIVQLASMFLQDCAGRMHTSSIAEFAVTSHGQIYTKAMVTARERDVLLTLNFNLCQFPLMRELLDMMLDLFKEGLPFWIGSRVMPAFQSSIKDVSNIRKTAGFETVFRLLPVTTVIMGPNGERVQRNYNMPQPVDVQMYIPRDDTLSVAVIKELPSIYNIHANDPITSGCRFDMYCEYLCNLIILDYATLLAFTPIEIVAAIGYIARWRWATAVLGQAQAEKLPLSSGIHGSTALDKIAPWPEVLELVLQQKQAAVLETVRKIGPQLARLAADKEAYINTIYSEPRQGLVALIGVPDFTTNGPIANTLTIPGSSGMTVSPAPSRL